MDTLLIVALVVPLVTVVAVMRRGGAGVAWREAAASTGLTCRAGGGGSGFSLKGSLGHAEIHVDSFKRTVERNKAQDYTRVRASSDISQGLMVGSEGFWQQWSSEHGEDAVDLAGVAFDEHIIARGAVPEIFAVFNGDTRSQLRELQREHSVRVIEGVVLLEHQGIIRDGDELAKLIRRVARLAMALSLQGPAVVDRLGANVVTDANPLVRLRNLEILLSRYPDSKSAELACQHALGDRSYPVKVLAAEQCGAEGMETMEQVVRDQRAPMEMRSRCIELLEERMDRADLIELLEGCLENEGLRERAICGLAKAGNDPGTETLLGLLERAIPSGWIAFSRSITALGRDDLTAPLEVLLDESRGDGWISVVDGSPCAEPSPAEAGDRELGSARVVITEELLVDQEVRAAAHRAMRALRGWEWDSSDGAVDDGDAVLEGPGDGDDSATPLDSTWVLRMALDGGEELLSTAPEFDDDGLPAEVSEAG